MLKIQNLKIKIFEPFLWIYFIWYYLPFARGLLNTSIHKMLFFIIFVIGCFLLILSILAKKNRIVVKMSMLVPVLIYMFVFSLLVFMEVGDASRHIRVSFTFWGTLIVYFLLYNYEDARKRLTLLFLVLFVITACTSIFGVMNNSHAARTLTYASNAETEDRILQLLNIGGLSFFQSMVSFIPILVGFFAKKRKRLIPIVGLVLIAVGLFSASFTILILIGGIAIVIGYIASCKLTKKTVIIGLIVLMVLIIPWTSLVDYLADNISNALVSERLKTIAIWLESNAIEGKLESRLNLYKLSFDTFMNHPLGVGPEYSYVEYKNGIGYHSQILDDLARYGIYAFLFYLIYFTQYKKLVEKQWAKLNMKYVAMPVTVVYFLLLLTNPGFTSAFEGAMMFFVIPGLPDLLNKESKGR